MPDQDSNGSFRVGYGKAVLDITSRHLLTVLLLLGLFVVVGGAYYAQWSFVTKAMAEHSMIREEAQLLREEHRILHDSLSNKLDEVTFMLSRPESERPALSMPRSLRSRIEQR
jgi:hypothetical protein